MQNGAEGGLLDTLVADTPLPQVAFLKEEGGTSRWQPPSWCSGPADFWCSGASGAGAERKHLVKKRITGDSLIEFAKQKSWKYLKKKKL